MKLPNMNSGYTAQILMYHSIVEVQNDPFHIHINPDRFESQLKILKKYYSPISIAEIVSHLSTGKKLPKKAVVLTFDDGYANNLTIVTPLLEKYGIPATIFIVTGKIGTNQEFWWDKLEQFILSGDPINTSLFVELLSFDKEERRNIQQKNCTPMSIYYLLWRKLFKINEKAKEEFFENLSSVTGKKTYTRSSLRPLTKPELLFLSQNKHWEVGVHTKSHYPLKSLSLEKQYPEIQESKNYIERTVNRPSLYFSYPHGSYSKETASILAELGFHAALTSSHGRITDNSNVFFLPRIQVGNWSTSIFRLKLLKWKYFS